jgi:hypothetical protein
VNCELTAGAGRNEWDLTIHNSQFIIHNLSCSTPTYSPTHSFLTAAFLPPLSYRRFFAAGFFAAGAGAALFPAVAGIGLKLPPAR